MTGRKVTLACLTKEDEMGCRNNTRRTWSTVVAFCAICSVWVAVFAQTSSPALQRGRKTFHQSCAVCHGERGDGKGPAAPALSPRPINLTTLTRQKGTFPADQIAAALRGTAPLAAHGGPMLFWGAMFLADANGDQAKAEQNIQEVVEFIQSIQVK
jgi:hypothetical protein